MNKIYMIMYSVNEKKGGGTQAMLARTKLFRDHGVMADIATFDYNPDYKKMENRLKAYSKMHALASILNVYDYYKELNTNGNNDIRNDASIQETKHDSKYLTKGKTLYFLDGEIVLAKHFSENGDVDFVEYYDKSEKVKERHEFIDNRLHRKVKYVDQKIISDRIYTEEGFCFVTRFYEPDTENITGIFLFEKQTGKTFSFKNEREFGAYWLTEVCKNDVKNNVKPNLIIDGQGSLPRILLVPKHLAKRYYILHTNHFQSPYKIGSPIARPYDYVFKHLKELDGLIVLTEKQKKDIEIQFGRHKNIFVIPNYSRILDIAEIEKNPYKVTLVGRLAKQKAIHRAIEMFRFVVEKEQNAILEIFGEGSEKEFLQKEIKKHKLEKNVFLRGHSADVQKEMQESIVTVLTSIFEGFGLVVAESLLNCTPVVSLDCNYGPSDIISHGEDGYIETDLKKMADRVLFFIKNPDYAIKMGKRGRKNMIQKYSSEAIFKKWSVLLDRDF
ncbi:glycosyltransferase [Camelliibacillus cellulosilyticus]|uniref:Glycosyltransferase n=1 Tax=Camelliibacillus cellulosilyticus TaxID=2174486 RepID=A0ABV9GUS2_9BACL